MNELNSEKIIQKDLEESIEWGRRYWGRYAKNIEIGAMHNIVTFHGYDYLIDFWCFWHIFLNISFLTQWILQNLFVLSSHYSIQSFYLFRFFLPCSGMSQQVNFAFSDISSLFYYITSNSYCKFTIFGTHIVDTITHIRSKMWTY